MDLTEKFKKAIESEDLATEEFLNAIHVRIDDENMLRLEIKMSELFDLTDDEREILLCTLNSFYSEFYKQFSDECDCKEEYQELSDDAKVYLTINGICVIGVE